MSIENLHKSWHGFCEVKAAERGFEKNAMENHVQIHMFAEWQNFCQRLRETEAFNSSACDIHANLGVRAGQPLH